MKHETMSKLEATLREVLLNGELPLTDRQKAQILSKRFGIQGGLDLRDITGAGEGSGEPPAGDPPAPDDTTEKTRLESLKEADKIEAEYKALSGKKPEELLPSQKDWLEKNKPGTPAAPAKPEEILTDGEGNIINEKGEIVKKFEDVKDMLLEDDDGNLVNTKGEIIVKKEDVAAHLEKQGKEKDKGKPGDEAIVTKVQKAIGIEVKDENGKPVVYEDTEEGLVNYTADAITVGVEAQINSFLEQNPRLVAFARHLAAGKNEADFFSLPNSDWSKAKIVDGDAGKEGRLEIIKANVVRKGFSEKEAKEYVDMIVGSGKEAEKAKEALVELQAWQTKQTEEQDKADAKARKEEEEKTLNYWNAVKDIVVTKGNLEDINIPVGIRQDFFDYLSKPVEGTKSQATLDIEKESAARRLQTQLFRYLKYDVSKLVQSEAYRKRAEDLKSKFKQQNQATPHRKIVRKVGSGGGNVTISNLIGGR